VPKELAQFRGPGKAMASGRTVRVSLGGLRTDGGNNTATINFANGITASRRGMFTGEGQAEVVLGSRVLSFPVNVAVRGVHRGRRAVMMGVYRATSTSPGVSFSGRFSGVGR
jgi:hypothetical protein